MGSLFSELDLRLVLEEQKRKLQAEIESIAANTLLNTAPADIIKALTEKHRVDAIRLREDEIAVDQREASIDVSRNARYDVFHDDRIAVAGNIVTFVIPYAGDKELFRCRASTFNYGAPRAEVTETHVRISYPVTDHDAQRVKEQFARDLSSLKENIGWVERDVRAYNEALQSDVTQRINGRREWLLKNQGLVASLGFPMVKRNDTPSTYVVPISRRPSPVSFPASTQKPFQPEPSMEMEHYEHILKVIQSMVEVMERSPRAFHGMGEEDLRTQFLVQLNGQYQGQATGETFNFDGKTDILVRHQGRNLFIGECKIYKGPKSVSGAIDQVLGYLSWRDSKAALLMFNREGKPSSVLESVKKAVLGHPECKREVPYSSARGIRVAIRQKQDPEKETILTVLVFDIPSEPEDSE